MVDTEGCMNHRPVTLLSRGWGWQIYTCTVLGWEGVRETHTQNNAALMTQLQTPSLLGGCGYERTGHIPVLVYSSSEFKGIRRDDCKQGKVTANGSKNTEEEQEERRWWRRSLEGSAIHEKGKTGSTWGEACPAPSLASSQLPADLFPFAQCLSNLAEVQITSGSH